MPRRIEITGEIDDMIRQLRHKMDNSHYSEIMDALKDGLSPREIAKMHKNRESSKPHLQIYDV
jgi:hypothetical protein